jgi:hypothetical protein
MVDDWLTKGNTAVEARRNLAVITAVFVAAGFIMAIDKEEVGQRLTFLGVLIDTVKMCISFDETQARSMALQLSEHLKMIERGYDLDETTIRSVAGKLQWYSEVVQSGKVHVRSWWLYCRHRSRLTPKVRYKLVQDTKWWIQLTETWAKQETKGIEYPIVSAAELLAEKSSIEMIISDASGVDGFGYYSGPFDADDFSFYTRRWGGQYEFSSSHTGELQALNHYLQFRYSGGRKLLIWITDCQSAAFSVNKGRCREDSGLEVLSNIFEICDEYRVQLLALWIPREENRISDYLSHLCVIINREEFEGDSIRDLSIFKDQGETSRGEEEHERNEKGKYGVPKLVYRPGMEFEPSGFQL